MKRYPDCVRTDGMCGVCSLVNRGLDCHNSKVNKLLYQRSLAGMTQKAVADAAGVNIRQLQKYESGEYAIENMTLKSALAISKALECDINDLL